MLTSSATFPPHARLRQRADFQKLFNEGATFSAKGLRFFVRPNGRAHGRLGVVVSKKNAKRAVDRNHGKRLQRAWFRTHADAWVGWDVLVLINRRWVEGNRQQRWASTVAAWERCTAWRDGLEGSV